MSLKFHQISQLLKKIGYTQIMHWYLKLLVFFEIKTFWPEIGV